MMLVHLTFHKLQFQNRSWDLPNLNLVHITQYRCTCCVLQQCILKALCQQTVSCVCAVTSVAVFMIPVQTEGCSSASPRLLYVRAVYILKAICQ